jgi:hypothetical protein
MRGSDTWWLIAFVGGVGGRSDVGAGWSGGRLEALLGFRRSKAAISPAYPMPIDASARASPSVHLNMAELTFKESRLRDSVCRIFSTSVSANIIRNFMPKPPL